MYFLTSVDKGRFATLLSGGKESSRSHYLVILPLPLPLSLSLQEIGPEGTSRVFVCCKAW